jgi:tetratricopeptide (TPR) repeat protein
MRARIVLVVLAALLVAATLGWAWHWQPGRWAERHLAAAATLAAERRHDAARAELRTLLARLPRHRDARWRLIQLELEQRRLEQAYLELKAFTELFPDSADAWLLVAR